ncbi:MAG: histidine kinase [Burkholderiaceae bacterium]
MASLPPASPPDRVDWSQLWLPGPRREFTADELARAGGDRPGRTFVVMLTITLAMTAEALLQHAPADQLARLAGLLVAIYLVAFQGGMALWRHPTRRRLAAVTGAALLAYVAFALGLRWRLPDADVRQWYVYTAAVCFSASTLGFWFVTVYRSQQIGGRLRELAERDRALALARQLATAQVKPHFLFNTLASLQHWVDTRDERAGPMLAALTAYLRATLPLFDRPELSLAQELEAVQRYLDVMQARWGGRLRHELQAEPAVLDAAVPPGTLLTLVENAVEHGVGAQLAGGRVQLQARRLPGDRVQVDVLDDGPGLPAGAPPEAGHLGLANTRMRLAQAFGPQAQLRLGNRPEGGCLAQVTWPFRHPAAPDTTSAP